ncbi:hypothetical protein P3X46_017880 [Hevea brasiliensis]|uniref:Uncharacterized protein n=1 Tax=Hevea brasiliensis TaxID=3981 RepID=A0ABQ9LP13_HEVBR|nr:uncharacterized protein At4g13230-like [Hevea brasiliensis]KAJ9169721.1 hypothetical protein P3X46_017880 [Hevea brasiliensis]
MASLALASTLLKCCRIGAVVTKSPWSSRVFVPATRHFQAHSRKEASNASETASQATKQGINEAKNVGQDVKNKAASVAEEVSQKTKEAAGEVSKVAQDVTEKAKQTIQDAWGSVKDTSQTIKDKVSGKAEESKEFVKENAESVKRCMNSKN